MNKKHYWEGWGKEKVDNISKIDPHCDVPSGNAPQTKKRVTSTALPKRV